MTKKEKKLLKKYISIILVNVTMWIGIFILAMIKAGIYVIG